MGAEIKGFKGEYRWLSNFWEHPVTYDGEVWPSAEHAYQAQKAATPEHRELIRQAATPEHAKILSRTFVHVAGWERKKYPIMLEIQRAKYQDPEMAARLLATGEAYIEETNTWNDRYWGVCYGHGMNQLGQILMTVRRELRKEEAP